MLINLPWIEPMDTRNMPTNFKELVEESFRKFTDGTSKEYRQVDKLLYLDYLRRKYTYPYEQYDSDNVRKLMHDVFDCQLDNYGEIAGEDDFYSLEFMEQCYAAGDRPFYKHIEDIASSSSEEHRIHNIIFEIIKIVVNWEETE